MWTTILASYAAVVSTSALIVSYLSYRSGGPQLSGSAYIYGRYDIQGPTLCVALHNRGRGAVTVESLELWGAASTSIGGIDLPLPVIGWTFPVQQDMLPSRIEGNSGERWHFPAGDVAKRWLTAEDLAELQVNVGLATGKSLNLRVDTSDIDVLRGQKLPDWQPDHFTAQPKLRELEVQVKRLKRLAKGL
jgi:hypothetical protein